MVYVVLAQSGAYWSAQHVQKTKPLDASTFIKGTVASGGVDTEFNVFQNQRFGSSRIHIIYGVEDYFIPEGKGRGFGFGNKDVAARVVVDENGNAVLKQLYIDGKPWP